MGERLTINPVTRLEGHGKIDIFLNDDGDVEEAYFQVTELRGFEKFCIGRPVEEMPRIVPNICGVCPTPHNLASTKALDVIYGAAPTPTAKLIRKLQLCAAYVEDHFLHFFFLGAPDFIVGPDASPKKRNILGIIEELGVELAKEVIEVRKRTRNIIKLIASKPAHPEGGLPGGVSKGIKEEDRNFILETANMCVKFAIYALKLFKEKVLGRREYLDLIMSDAYTLKTYYMGMVDDYMRQSYYEGMLRIVDPDGNEIAFFHPREYVEHIAEWVEPWTYVKLNYLRRFGWKGIKEGWDSSLYRVGPLARYNVCYGMATPLAQKEHEEMVSLLGKPVHSTLAYHWARLIEALQAAEEMQKIANDPLLTGKDIRNTNYELTGKGVGCLEACRGVLIHDYEVDGKGIVTRVNLIVATQHNAAPIALSVKKAAKAFISKGRLEDKEGLLNYVEMAFRAYDPCFGCATHVIPGRMPLMIEIRDSKGTVIDRVSRF
ncbi:MAG: Ni/Fe hydrogenase subunit alpha [Desulfobacterota bacterium]|nr:Ni/Fe hydrogenase subunit alpha [Thermodesulfobacteriota bacterium]MDW8001976.1 Ni/Fe hydrogenase subunit alpha [Deltaproteobacteria bacterium]